jgi:hypothetical protein
MLAVATESAQANGVWQLIALVAAARAEHALLNGLPDQAVTEAAAAYEMALRARQPWLTGELAWWMHRAGQRPDVPVWIAEPYWLMLSGNWRAAAEAWQRMGCPYEQAEALACGDAAAVRRAQAILDRLGAVPAAGKLRLPRR